jgi:hypothetical protein
MSISETVGGPIEHQAASASSPGFVEDIGADGGIVVKPHTPPQDQELKQFESTQTTVGPTTTSSLRPNASPIVLLSPASIDNLKQPFAPGIVTPIADGAETADISIEKESATIPHVAASDSGVADSGSWLVSTAPLDKNEMRKTSILASISTFPFLENSASQGENRATTAPSDPVKPGAAEASTDNIVPVARKVVHATIA